ADEFYKKIAAPNVKPGTSQPSMGECRDVYEKLVSEGLRKMVVLTIASELSGTYSVASTTAQQMDGTRIVVVDSRTLAGGIALIEGQRLHAAHERSRAGARARRLGTGTVPLPRTLGRGGGAGHRRTRRPWCHWTLLVPFRRGPMTPASTSRHSRRGASAGVAG